MPAAYTSALVENLEQQLQLSLRPIQPDQQFVDHLHNRLTTSPTISLEQRGHAAFGLLLIAFSLFTGVLLIWFMRLLRPSPDS
jgi:hypothetical protein